MCCLNCYTLHKTQQVICIPSAYFKCIFSSALFSMPIFPFLICTYTVWAVSVLTTNMQIFGQALLRIFPLLLLKSYYKKSRSHYYDGVPRVVYEMAIAVIYSWNTKKKQFCVLPHYSLEVESSS